MALVKRTHLRGAGTAGVFRVEGMERLLKNIQRLPGNIRAKPLRKAVRASGNVVLKRARRLAPRGRGAPVRNDGSPRKRLADTLKLKVWPNARDKSGKPVMAIIGSRSGEAPHAHLVHQGTNPHLIRSKRGTTLKLFNGKYARVVRHPGARPNPYLTNALAASRNQVYQKMKNILRSEIQTQLYTMIDRP